MRSGRGAPCLGIGPIASTKSAIIKSLVGLLLVWCQPSHGQNWPTKPVRIVVPFAAGGSVDTMARTFAAYFTKIWAQPVIVDNRPGSGGHLGAEAVAHSPPDGSTLLMATSGLAAGAALYRKLNYDPAKDLAPISMLVAAPSIFAMNPSLPPTNLKDFIALAKSQPGKINFGSTGMGSGPHLAMEIFISMTGISMVHVPYKGDSQLYPALLANDVQVAILAPQTGVAQIKSGRLRALAITGPDRFWSLPDVPGMVESGLPAFDYRGWVGIFAPGNTPKNVVAKINSDSIRVLGLPEMVSKYLPSWGSDATPGSVESFEKRYAAEIDEYKRIVQRAGIPMID